MNRLRRFRDDYGGGVALAFAIALPVMIGFGGAATEIGTWLLTRRAMQGAADAAAVSAVNATIHGGPDITTQAKGVAAQNNWPDGARGITVTVNQPPSVGNFTGNAQAVEVIIAQAQPLFFSALLPGVTAPTIKARGVAGLTTSGGGCLLGIGTGNSLQINGNGNMTLSGGCDIDGNGSIQFNGNHSTASAHSFDIAGTVSSPSQLTVTTPGTSNDASQFTDPNSLTLAPGACSTFAGTFTAGSTYCGGVPISGGNITMPSGIYYIRGGSFAVSNGTLTSAAGGVTIVLMGTAAAPTVSATLTINGQANVNLTGMPGNQGLIFYEDPTATSPTPDQIAGQGNVTLTGEVDLRNDTLNLGGNGSVSSPTCLKIIAKVVISTGNASLASNCSGTGVNNIGHGNPRLIE